MGCLCLNITSSKSNYDVDIKADNCLSLKERDSLVQEYRKSLENGTKINNNNETDSITLKNLQMKNDLINNSSNNPFVMANLENNNDDNNNNDNNNNINDENYNKNAFEKYNDIFNDVNISMNKKNTNKRKNNFNDESNNDIYDLGLYKIKNK